MCLQVPRVLALKSGQVQALPSEQPVPGGVQFPLAPDEGRRLGGQGGGGGSAARPGNAGR